MFGSYLFPETQVRVGEMVQWLMVDSSLPKNLDDGSLLLHVVLLGGYESLKKWNIVNRSFEFCKHAFEGVWSPLPCSLLFPSQRVNGFYCAVTVYAALPQTQSNRVNHACFATLMTVIQNKMFSL